MDKIDFSYAFAPPHRVTLCMPQASKKCLADALVSGVRLSWTDTDLSQIAPAGMFYPLKADKQIDFTAELDGNPLSGVRWNRMENRIPSLEYLWENEMGGLLMEVVPYEGGEVIRLHACNTSDRELTIALHAACPNAFNLRWVETDSPYNVLLGHCGASPDRMLLFSVDAPPAQSRSYDCLDVAWTLSPGEKTVSYMIRPIDKKIDDIDRLLHTDWEKELNAGLSSWRSLLESAVKINLPDTKLMDAFYACLADMFVMREKQYGGKTAGACGTELYRCPNAGEATLQTYVYNRAGFPETSYESLDFLLTDPEPDGNWSEPRRWIHHMWSSIGTKSRGILDYYLYTKDRVFLEVNFERMLASARWVDSMRAKTKTAYDREKPPTWGLMPRGMGDCGLKCGDDLFGVFYPHNFYCCEGIGHAVKAAEILGRSDVLEELRGYYDDYKKCLLDSLEKGAIDDPDGYRWIPGSPGNVTGSHWGVIEAAEPCHILPPDHPLIEGTLRMLSKNMSEGGLPKDIGWLKNGLWVAIAIDAISYTHIARGEEQKAIDYLYAAINHATPLFSWCEERLPEKNATVTTGDVQHSWTPIALCLLFLDMLAQCQGDTLTIGRALDKSWLSVGDSIEVSDIGSHWGKISYVLRRESAKTIEFSLTFQGSPAPNVKLNLKPFADSIKTASVSGADYSVEGTSLTLQNPAASIRATIKI